MKRLPRHIVPLVLLFAVTAVGAQTAYRWVDKDGKVHYGDQPPPPKAALKVEQKRLGAPGADDTLPYAARKAIEDFPLTLWVSEECKTLCDDARNWLKRRGAPYSEKMVQSEEDLEALKALTGGEAQVPVLQVGPKPFKGFQSSEWKRLLDAAGYPEARAAGK